MSAPALPKLERCYTCVSCTYGVSVPRPPERCPMCGDHVWRPDGRKQAHGG